MLLLRRDDGSVAAAFSASGVTPAEVARTAEEDHRQNAKRVAPDHGSQRLGLATLGTLMLSSGERRAEKYWYNPKTRSAERVPTPVTDAEAIGMLAGYPNSGAFIAEYERRRGEQGMEIEQALIFVGHHFRMEHLLYQPVR